MFQQTGCFLSYLFSPLLKALLLPHPQLCSALQKLLPARSPESLGQGWDSLPGMGWIYPSQVWDGFTLGPAMVPPLPPLPDGEVFLCGGPSGCRGMLGHPLPPIAALGGHVFKNSRAAPPGAPCICHTERHKHLLRSIKAASPSMSPLEVWALQPCAPAFAVQRKYHKMEHSA